MNTEAKKIKMKRERRRRRGFKRTVSSAQSSTVTERRSKGTLRILPQILSVVHADITGLLDNPQRTLECASFFAIRISQLVLIDLQWLDFPFDCQ